MTLIIRVFVVFRRKICEIYTQAFCLEKNVCNGLVDHKEFFIGLNYEASERRFIGW